LSDGGAGEYPDMRTEDLRSRFEVQSETPERPVSK